MNYTLTQQVKVLTGAGCIKEIGQVLKEAGYSKAFIVTTPGMVRRGQIGQVTALLDAEGIGSVIYDKTQPDPPSDLVDAGAALCKEENCDCVLAIGGGSAIDMAKGINVLRFNEGSILDYTTQPMALCHGLITVPTTSGTGSELSNGAIITNVSTGQKLPIMCINNMPEYAILDPELTVTMPVNVTRETGLDTFSHAAEAYTSILSNDVTGLVCESVMESVVANLGAACSDGTNIAARSGMQAAAALGGWMLYNACAHVGHSFAHVTGATLHIVHGNACSYGLPGVLRLISPAVPAKVKRIGEILGAQYTGTETPEEIGNIAAEAYKSFTASVGFNRAPIAVDDTLLDQMADGIVHEAFAGFTPVPVTKDAAMTLLKDAFEA